jgi:quinol monooxygenase YgiN
MRNCGMEQILAGTFEVEPADRDTFLAGRVELMRRARVEPGCIVYVFAADPVEPGRVVLFERWESEDALEGHRRGLAASPPADPGVKVLRSEILQWAATPVPRP